MIQCTKVEKNIDASFAIGPLSLKVDPGTVTALVGSNGSGKSTLLRMLSGLVHPDFGKIKRFGSEQTDWKEKIAFIPQSSKGFHKYTMKHLAEIHEIGYKTWDANRFYYLLERYGLPLDKEVDELSGGMQRKALGVLALSRGSKLLIMDEPLAGVDIAAQEQLQEDWLSYLEADLERSIVFATHVPDEMKDFADYIVCMNRGSIVGNYEKDGLLESYGRFWSNASIEKTRNLVGVYNVIQRGPQVEVISKNKGQTEAEMNRFGLEITMKQPLKMAEILRILLKEGEDVYDTDN